MSLKKSCSNNSTDHYLPQLLNMSLIWEHSTQIFCQNLETVILSLSKRDFIVTCNLMHFELSSFADFHLGTNTAFKTADLRLLKICGDNNYKITLPKSTFIHL